MTINIKSIDLFFKNVNPNILMVNQVNDQINIFYLEVLNYFANINNIKILKENNDQEKNSINLFESSGIYFLETNNKNEIENVITKNDKYLIFCNYKNFKLFNKKINSINTYNFREDLKYFINNELKIKNEDLVSFLYDNPYFISSETSKYLINSNQYSRDHSFIEEKNHILNIRKSIFEIKQNNFSIKNLYQSIKKEAEYKKLSFLTF
jgi:hypothetical protein